MKRPQWILALLAIAAVAALFIFGKTVPAKKTVAQPAMQGQMPQQAATPIATDTILAMAKKQLPAGQVLRLNSLENSISRGDVKDQQLKVYHQLSHFWGDSAGMFEPYAWYVAQAARLENSEKSLTFAAHLFLDNLQQDANPQLVQWKALQAKDLFERSLIINPNNDSSKVGIGACYLFGNISAAPMEGLGKIREVLDKDSTNVYAQITMAKGASFSGQYDKAISRLMTVNRIQPQNVEAILMLADIYERTNKKAEAINWYQQSLKWISRADVKEEIGKRIQELKK